MIAESKTFMLETWNWTGYSCQEVTRAFSRLKAFENAIEESVEKKYPHISTEVLFDDGEKVVIHVVHGYEFYGWRLYNLFVYFDPHANVETDFDEINLTESKIHRLSIPIG